MRAFAVAVLLVLLAVAAPRPAVAPTMMENHLNPIVGTLAPLENRTLPPFGFDDAPLAAGWVFLLEAKANGTLGARLAHGASVAGNWQIPADAAWYATTILPETGYYNLTLTNLGAEYVTYSLYYDQSCECLAKAFPADVATQQLVVPNGYVIFNTEVPGPIAMDAQFNKPAALSLRITAATLAQPGGRWPADFTALGTTDTLVPRQAGPGLPVVWLYDLNVSVRQAVRLYYFVQAVALDPANLSRADATVVGPSYSSSPLPSGSGSSSISPLLFIGVAVVLAAAGGVILWRGRERPAPKRKTTVKPATKEATSGREGRRNRTTSNSRRHGGGRGGGRRRRSRARRPRP